MDFNVFITNPTSIGCKEKEFYDLINMHHLGLVACAETPATTAIQRTFGSHMMTKGFKSNWSNPVQPHVIELDGNPSLRDRAGGTADFATFPSRRCWNGIADEWMNGLGLIEFPMLLYKLLHRCRFLSSMGFLKTLLEQKILPTDCLNLRWNNPKRLPSRPLFLGISNWMFTRYMHQNNLQSNAFKPCKLCTGNLWSTNAKNL